MALTFLLRIIVLMTNRPYRGHVEMSAPAVGLSNGGRSEGLGLGLRSIPVPASHRDDEHARARPAQGDSNGRQR